MLNKRLAPVLVAGVLMLGSVPGSAQVAVDVPDASTYDHNAFGNEESLSDDMSNSGDVLVTNDIELGGAIYLDATLFMNRDATSPSSGDQALWFADDLNQLNEFFFFDDSTDAFGFSNDLQVDESLNIVSTNEGFVQLFSTGPQMKFIVDSDNDNLVGTDPHLFVWYNNAIADANRVMQLQSNGNDLGDLFIAAQLTENTAFDIAEAFWESEPLEPGDLVSVDLLRPDAVRLTSDIADRTVLGVVSTYPGIIMGGGAFSVKALRDSWGDEIAEAFELERAELEAAVYAESDGLRAARDLLGSPGAFAAQLESEWLDSAPNVASDGDGPDRGRPRPSSEELEEAYNEAKLNHEESIFDQTMQKFFEERFAEVALAGRVPVKVDAGYGAIEPGDPLTSSPTPGVAMKATGPGPIVGTALEAHSGGETLIMAFIHRGWYPGDAGVGVAGTTERLEARDVQLAELRSDNARLQQRLRTLERAVATLAESASQDASRDAVSLASSGKGSTTAIETISPPTSR